jgi:hypothetical protein
MLHGKAELDGANSPVLSYELVQRSKVISALKLKLRGIAMPCELLNGHLKT